MPVNRFFFSFFLLTFLLSSPLLNLRAQTTTPVARIIVEAGDHLRINTPVSISIENLPIREADNLMMKLTNGTREMEVPCQLEPGITPKIWWIISDTLKPGEKGIYLLLNGKERDWPTLKTNQGEKNLTIFAGTMPILQYNHAPVPLPEGVDSSFTRSGFIHPLWAPSGEILTRIQPPDHYHHYGIWNPWTKTSFEGRQVDFWNLGDKKGTVRFRSYISTTEGPVYGGFRVLHDHVDLTAPAGEKIAINEEWDVRIWNSENLPGEFWLWDFTSVLNCAGSSPVNLDQYRYGGGLGYRATENWTSQNSHILTSEGKTRKDGDATEARWCNIYGKTKRVVSGILFMSYPENRAHPEPMRIWPEDNGDVFFEFCPIRHKEWPLEPGKAYVLRYRMYVYNGTISVEEADRLWQDFANPPLIKIEELVK